MCLEILLVVLACDDSINDTVAFRLRVSLLGDVLTHSAVNARSTANADKQEEADSNRRPDRDKQDAEPDHEVVQIVAGHAITARQL